LFDRVRELHVKQVRRVVQPPKVVGQAKHGTAFRRLVGADPFEDTGAVVKAVRADVDLGVGPVDKLAVHPDLLELLHASPFGAGAAADSTRGSRKYPSPFPRRDRSPAPLGESRAGRARGWQRGEASPP